jgi:hypothetical protein
MTLDEFIAAQTLINSKVDDRLAAVEGDIVKLKEHDAKVDGLFVKINDLIVNNPKVTAVLSALLTAAALWITAKLGVIGPEPEKVSVPGPEKTIIREVPAPPAKTDPPKNDKAVSKPG